MGGRIKKVRIAKGISRSDLAKAAGIAYSTLADIENERQQSSTALHAIAKHLRVPPEYLATGQDTPDLSEPAPMTPHEEALLHIYRHASRAGRKAIESVAATFAKGENPFSKSTHVPKEKGWRAA